MITTDVRIIPEQRDAALKALRPFTCGIGGSIDIDPPASGPEIEISVCDTDEATVRAALEAVGVSVLAIREREEIEPRAWTADEVRDMLIASVWSMARYWASLDGSNVSADATPLDRTTGMAHSMLALLDGASELPSFKLVPDPHPDDEGFNRAERRNWFSNETVIDDMLHEHLYRDDMRRDR